MPEIAYYAGPALSVTSATVTYKATTVPVSAIASVSVQHVSRAKIRFYIQAIAAGFVIIGLAALLRLLYGFTTVLGAAVPSVLSWFGILLVALAVALVVLALVGLVQAARSRDVVVGLLSGSRLIVRVPTRDAGEIKQAVDRAITAREVSGGGTVSAADELGRLAALRDSGVLTSQDWDRAKDMYLGKPPDARVVAVEHLRALYRLHTEGVLSLSEFNTKKWEVLTKTD